MLAGVPWTATYIQAKGDPIADLYEDIAAEEKARATYQWLINLAMTQISMTVSLFKRKRNRPFPSFP